jgi:hypothetical protein
MYVAIDDASLESTVAATKAHDSRLGAVLVLASKKKTNLCGLDLLLHLLCLRAYPGMQP